MTLTAHGYAGEDVESILLRLLAEAGNDVAAAERGIVYIDEIYKLARKSIGRSATRDVNGESVQHALLKMLEGTIVTVPALGNGQNPPDHLVRIDTTNILFICGGAFESIDKIVEHRRVSRSIGFGAPIENIAPSVLTEITPADLIAFGLTPELVGRLPVIATMDPLTEHDLVDILTNPKNAIVTQFKNLLDLDNVQVELTDAALREIAREPSTRTPAPEASARSSSAPFSGRCSTRPITSSAARSRSTPPSL